MKKSKKLTHNQIQKLYDFTQKHYVEYYDLQTEFIQELAKGIEKQWEENPDEDFDTALEKEFKKYGIFGFSDIVEKRKQVLGKYYIKLVFSQMWGFLKSLNWIWILLLIGVVFALLNYFVSYNVVIFLVSFWGFFLFSLVMAFQNSKKYNRKVKKTGKRWLLQEIIYRTGNFYLAFVLLGNILNFLTNIFFREENPSVENVYIQIVMSIILVCFLVLLYLIFFCIPKNADEYCNKFYCDKNIKIN